MEDVQEVITPKPKLETANSGKKKVPQLIRNIRLVISILSVLFPWLAGQFAFFIYAMPRRSKKKITDPILDTAAIFYLPYRGGKLKIYSWGNSSRRVLLMHGWESKATTFRELIPSLLDKGFTVIAMDAPAHGGSSGNTTNFVTWGEAIAEVLEYYSLTGLPIHSAVAHSFGGSTLFFMMTLRKIVLKNFVMISSPIFYHTYFQSFCKLFRVKGKAKEHMLNKMDRILGRSFLDFDLSNDAHEVLVEQMMVIHDDDDEVIDSYHLEKMQSVFKKPDYVRTKGLGHYQMIKDPEVIERIGAFLTKN